jgi:hypothetical protein
MSLFEVITVVIAIGGLFVAWKSLKRSHAIGKQQSQLQAEQLELVRIQLQMHQRMVESADKSGSTTKPADVRVSLERTGKNARFVVRNWGLGAASNVEMEVKPISGNGSPIITSDYNEKFPIPRLAPGGECSVIAALSFDTGTNFDASWSWNDEDGKGRNESSRVSL